MIRIYKGEKAVKVADKRIARLRRHRRVRKRVFGTVDRPRLTVFRSNRHVYAQIIDDVHGKTLVSASTLDPALKGEVKGGHDSEVASKVGRLVGQRAVEKGIEQVVFDRGGFIYHGRVKALADGARGAGLKF